MKKAILFLMLNVCVATFAFGQHASVWQIPEDQSNETLMSAILEPFEGTAVLIDVWGTWCGPCKNAMKSILPLKDELKDKDVTFVYLACKNSPKAEWETMIEDIHGEHYYLTTAQWNYILKTYGGGGVPLYILFDKKGELAYKSTGFPGVEKMGEEINKLL